ncbi:MFS transporter [Klebsiella pneumoniae]|nr:MFS transporter [Klebsiella pneumoniae]
MIIYDFSAYLTTDLIQPGIIHIIREFEADVALAPASVPASLFSRGLALQWLLGALSGRIGRRPILTRSHHLCFGLLQHDLCHVSDQYLIARFIQGTSICFISTVGYVSIQEAFDEKESIRIMAALTSIVLLAPVIGPLAGAGLMNFLHWKLLFAIIGAMSLLAWALLIFNMPETVTSQGRGFRPGEVFSEFVRAFKQPVVLTGALALSFSNLPIITWVALSPVILIDDGGMSRGAYAWTQVPVFGGVIIASIIVARFIKDPTSPRFIWRTIPIQLTGLLVLLAGNIAWPHTWWWSVSGTSLYALGTGLLFPVLFRFALFSHSLPKGTVSATINIVALSFMAASVEVARWVYFQAGGRIAFHCLALIAGIVVIMLVSALVKTPSTTSPSASLKV